jgi:O-antigen ligase
VAVGLAALMAGGLAVAFPLLGLVGFVAMISLNLSDNLIVYWGLPSINRLVAPGLAAILAWRLLFQGVKPFVDARTMLWLSVYLILIWVSSLYAYDRGATMEEFLKQFRFVLITLLVLAFFGIRGGIFAFSGTLVATSIFVGVLMIHKYATGDMTFDYGGFAKAGEASTRFMGPFRQPNEYGAILVFVMPFALDWALWGSRRWMRVLGATAAVLILSGILLSQSRGALVALFVGACVYAFMFDRRMVLRLAVAGALAAVMAGFALSEELLARFASIFAAADLSAPPDRAVEGRLGSWAVAMELFARSPFIGVGGGNFNSLYQDTANDLGLIFRGEDRSTHSIYLEYLSEYGLIGLAAMLAIFLQAGRGAAEAIRRMRALGEARLTAICGAHAAGLAGFLTAQAFLHGGLFLWPVVAIGIALPRIMDSELRHRTADA